MTAGAGVPSSRLANSTIAARSWSGMRSASGTGPTSPGGQQGAPGAQLLRLAGAVGGAIQKLAGQFLAGQLALLDELAQGILGADVKQVVQLLTELSRWRIADQTLRWWRAGCRRPRTARRGTTTARVGRSR